MNSWWYVVPGRNQSFSALRNDYVIESDYVILWWVIFMTWSALMGHFPNAPLSMTKWNSLKEEFVLKMTKNHKLSSKKVYWYYWWSLFVFSLWYYASVRFELAFYWDELNWVNKSFLAFEMTKKVSDDSKIRMLRIR